MALGQLAVCAEEASAAVARAKAPPPLAASEERSAELGIGMKLVKEAVYGSIWGFCAAIGAKFMHASAALALGAAALGLVLLASRRALASSFRQLQLQLAESLDVNHDGKLDWADLARELDRDGDGKLGWADLKIVAVEVIKVFGRGLPVLAGLTAGLLTGFKYA